MLLFDDRGVCNDSHSALTVDDINILVSNTLLVEHLTMNPTRVGFKRFEVWILLLNSMFELLDTLLDDTFKALSFHVIDGFLSQF